MVGVFARLREEVQESPPRGTPYRGYEMLPSSLEVGISMV